jgi:hypothetical protein
MNDWLKYNEFVPYAPDEAGRTIAMSHCRADKERLYITRQQDGLTILAYCHHCGKRGYYNERQKANITTLTQRKLALDKDNNYNYTLPKDLEKDVNKWPKDARVWIVKYGITDKEVGDYGIGYSDRMGGVVLPVYDSDGLALFTTRLFTASPSNPKYYTVGNRPHAVWYCSNSTNSDAVVVVEDVLSAIKCSRYISSCAILNTHLSDSGVALLTKRHKEFIVFLDDDNAEVKRKQLEIQRRLSVFGNTHIIHSMGKDPKEHSDNELKALLL